MVRVNSAKAEAAIAAMQAQMKGLRAETLSMNRTMPFGAASFSNLIKFGSRLQWVGRQLQYNFTLPILLAAGAATKFAMDQEAAFTHVAKVYGSVTDAQKFFMKQSHGALTAQEAQTKAMQAQRNELAALDDAFTAISNHYGVQKKEVDEVAGAWAAAGASGRRLAESVNDTMQAMIIGDMDAATATQSLISIQAQYNLNSKQLMSTLALLNNVENQTGISMGGLIDGFARAAGVARSAGVSTKELAAELAALVPATGSAANAGNALKTIYSRLMAPTQDSMDVMKAMGLNISSVAWQSSNAADRLHLMNKAFEGLSSSAKGVAASVIASRWQINKFNVLMDEMSKKTGFYQKALDAAADSGNNFKVMQSELNTVLKSDPRSLQRMMVILQNASVKIIQPLIPFIIYLADKLGDLANAFANMDPHLQKLILLGLVFLALVGPLVRYLGALKILIGVTGVSVSYLAAAFGILGKMLVVLPLRAAAMAFTALFDVIMMIVPTSLVAATETISIWKGLGVFLATWNKVVFAIFEGGWILALKGAALFAADFVKVQMLRFVTLLNFAKLFWMRWLLIQAGAELASMSRWAALWAYFKAVTLVGLATQFALVRKAMGIVAIFRTLGSALIVAWRATWAMLEAISAAGWALLRAQWIAQSIIGVGIFTRLRAALIVIWTTTAAASATIWKGMALTMVAFSRAGIAGVIGVFKALIPFLLRFGKFFVSWPAVIVGAIIGIAYVFRDQIKQILVNTINYIKTGVPGIAKMFNQLGVLILKVFHMLPQGVQNAMESVVNIVAAAAKAVYSWFSYINPFAHHSPSLVENVTNGMNVVLRQFSRLGGIKAYTQAAYREVSKFGKLTAGINMDAQVQDQKSTRKDLKKAGAGPAILGSYDKLTKMLNNLTPIAQRLNDKMSAQQRIVDALSAKLDKYNAKLQAAQDSLSYYASAPLKGMQAMDDQIEANTVAQNRLKLAMMDTADKAGGSLDDLKAKMDKINGAQELLMGKRNDLAAGGAGSEITGVYDAQIKALEKQKKGYDENADALQNMQGQLDALQNAADRLDLVKALKFDDLNYQIQKAANTTKELTFDQILAGVGKAQEQIAKYSPLVDKTQKQVDKQQKTLDKLTAKYNLVNDAIQAISDSLNNVADAADKVNSATKKSAKSAGSLSPAMSAFNMAKKGNFPDTGGAGIGPRKNWEDQSKQIQKFTDSLANQTSDMFSALNPFKPLVAKAKTAWSNIEDYFHAHPLFKGMKNPISAIFGGVGGGDTMKQAKSQINDIIGFLSGVFKWFSGVAGKAWKLLGPDIKRIAGGLLHGLEDIWKKIGPELKQFGDLWKPLGKAIKNFWTLLKPFLALVIGGFLFFGKIVTHVVAEVIGPLMKDIGDILVGVIRVIRGVLEVIIGIFSLNGDMIRKGFLDIFSGLGKIVWNLLTAAGHLIWNAVEGIVEGIFGFFKWLWNVLIGHSIIPDIVNGVVKWFKFWWDLPKEIYKHVLVPIFDFFKNAWNKLKDLISKWWPWIKAALQPWYSWASILWQKVLVPLWNKVQDAFDKIKTTISNARDKIGDIIGGIKDKFQGLVDAIQAVPGKIRGFVDNMKGAGTALINGLWNGMKSAGTVIKDLAGDIWGGVRDKINAGIDIINDKIPNSIGKGPLKVDLPDNPFPHLTLYTGGVVKGSKYGTPAMVGDKGYDEAVIPLTGPYAPRWARYQDQPSFNPKSLSDTGAHNTFIFNGNLEFPNVKSGDDVDTLISNLESLAG